MVDPAGDGVVLLHTTIAMLTLSWVVLCARLATRKWLKPEAMGMDDYLMFVGLVRSILSPTSPIWGAGIFPVEWRMIDIQFRSCTRSHAPSSSSVASMALGSVQTRSSLPT